MLTKVPAMAPATALALMTKRPSLIFSCGVDLRVADCSSAGGQAPSCRSFRPRLPNTDGGVSGGVYGRMTLEPTRDPGRR
jgi:hypothetical protein